MKKYTVDREQLLELMDRAINLFLEYQFKKGYEEPRAREEALRDVLGMMDSLLDGPKISR